MKELKMNRHPLVLTHFGWPRSLDLCCYNEMKTKDQRSAQRTWDLSCTIPNCCHVNQWTRPREGEESTSGHTVTNSQKRKNHKVLHNCLSRLSRSPSAVLLLLPTSRGEHRALQCFATLLEPTPVFNWELWVCNGILTYGWNVHKQIWTHRMEA